MPPTRPTTAVLIIAHGSRHPAANDDLHQLAGRLAEAGTYPIVEPAFLELAEPGIGAGGDRCVGRGAGRVLMIPYFLATGVHMLRDLAAAREDLQRRHPGVEFQLGPALGPHPLLDRLVIERIGELDRGESAPHFGPSAAMAERYAPLGDHEAEQPESD